MKPGNPVPDLSTDDEGIDDREPSRQVRDIQEIIARLEIVTKRLAHPLRTRASAGEPDTTDGGAPGF